MTFEEAAAVCDGTIQGLACLRQADVGAGRGSSSTARRARAGPPPCSSPHLGAHVTAVCNGKNVELVRSLGADEVIDYAQEDFTKNGQTYDVVFDAVGKHSFLRCGARCSRAGSTSRPTSPSYNFPLSPS